MVTVTLYLWSSRLTSYCNHRLLLTNCLQPLVQSILLQWYLDNWQAGKLITQVDLYAVWSSIHLCIRLFVCLCQFFPFESPPPQIKLQLNILQKLLNETNHMIRRDFKACFDKITLNLTISYKCNTIHFVILNSCQFMFSFLTVEQNFRHKLVGVRKLHLLSCMHLLIIT